MQIAEPFELGLKNVKNSLLTKFCENTSILPRVIVRKLSTNLNAGTKLNLQENSRALNLA